MLVKFDYNEWLKDQKRSIFDKDGDEIYPYDFGGEGDIKKCVIVDGKVYDLADEKTPVFFYKDDPSDHTVKKIPVSRAAEVFQMSANNDERVAVIECAGKLIGGAAGRFGHDTFFTKELWRKEKGFKDADKGEVIAAFMHWWFRYEYGFQTMPVGCSWTCSKPTTYLDDDKYYESYIKKYMPLFDAYTKWQISRR